MKGFEPSLLDKLFDDEPHAPMPTALRQLSLEELKSTVARELAKITGLPAVHLDQHYWRPDWTEPDKAVWSTSSHTSSVDFLEGCSRDNKVPQTL